MEIVGNEDVMRFLKEEFGIFEVLIGVWVVNWKMYGLNSKILACANSRPRVRSFGETKDFIDCVNGERECVS